MHLSERPKLAQNLRLHQLGLRWIAIAAVAGVTIALGVGAWLYHARRAQALTEKDTIVLADFDNKTGDAVFDDTLKTALNVSLRQSPFLNVLSDGDVAETLQLMTRPADTKLTPEVARELCQRAGSKAYLAGSIGSLGSEYVLGLKAVDCKSGNTLAQEQVTAASKEKVLDTLGEAATKLRGELGETLATVQKFDVPLAQVTTSSLEALKAFSLGCKLEARKAPPHPFPTFNEPSSLTRILPMPTCTGPDLLSSRRYRAGPRVLYQSVPVAGACRRTGKADITGDYYLTATGELDKAAQELSGEVESYPRAGELTAVWLQRTVGRGSMKKSRRPKARHACCARRSQLALVSHRVRPCLAAFRRSATGHPDARARGPDYNQPSHNDLYALAFLRADSAAMAEQQRWFAAHPDYESGGLALASDTEAYFGHWEARELTKRAVDSAIHVDSKGWGAPYRRMPLCNKRLMVILGKRGKQPQRL